MRAMPQTLEAERALLGDCLLDSASALSIAAQATPEDFYDLNHQEVFTAFCQRLKAGKKLDLVELVSSNVLSQASLATFIAATPSATSWPTHLQLIQEARQRREMIGVSMALSHAADDLEADPTVTLQKALSGLAVASRLGVKQSTSQERILDAYEQEVRKWDRLPLARTGIYSLDQAMGNGIFPGEVMAIIGGEGSMKTSLALKIVDTYLTEVALPVLYISIDMRGYRVALRRLLPLLDTDEKTAVSMMQEQDLEYLQARQTRTAQDKGLFHLVDGPHRPQDIEKLLGQIRPGLVVIDYLTAITGNAGDKDFEIMRKVCDALREWRQRFGASWVLLSQMSESAKAAQRQGDFDGRGTGGNEMSRLIDVGLELMMDTGSTGEEQLEDGYTPPPQLICTVTKCRAGQKGTSWALDYTGRTMTITGLARRVKRQKQKNAVFGRAYF